MSKTLKEYQAHSFRLLQAEALLELYRRDTGHQAADIGELEQWVADNGDTIRAKYGIPIRPEKVLSDEQIQSAMYRQSPCTVQ